MIGLLLIIFLLIPETPWWLTSKGKTVSAAKVLTRYNGHIEGYNVQEVIGVMSATVEEERYLTHLNKQEGALSIFKGPNLIRFFIAAWPKITQQFVGLSVFNTYATYFCQYPALLICYVQLLTNI